MINTGSIRIYALAVCFASLICGAIMSGLMAFNMVKIFYPELTIDPNHLRPLESDAAFRASHYNPANHRQFPTAFIGPNMVVNQPVQPLSEIVELTDQELSDMRSRQYQTTVSSHVFRAKQAAIQQLITILICIALYIYHWRLVSRFRGNS